MFPWRGWKLLIRKNKQSKIEIKRDGLRTAAAGGARSSDVEA